MRSWWVVIVLAGCFSRPVFQGGRDGGDDDAPHDAPRDTTDAPPNACAAIYVPDLVAYYDFENITGNTADDGVGAALEGTVINAQQLPGRTTGKTALSFTPSMARVEIGSPPEVTDLRAITVCAWFRLISQPTDSLSSVLFDKSVDGNDNGWNAYLNLDTGQSYIAFYTPFHSFKMGLTPVALGTWTHGCMSWDGSAGTAGITIYRNGAPDGVFKQSAGALTMPESDAGHSLTIGRGTKGVAPNFVFHGDIDDIALYHRVLSLDEITAIYDCP